MTGSIIAQEPSAHHLTLNKIVIVGTGLMGSGIAQVSVEAGIQVTMVGRTTEKCEAARTKIAANVTKSAKKKLANDPEGQQPYIDMVLANLEFATEIFGEHLDDADMVVEAVVENLKVKQKLFADLEEVVPSHCLLVTNTSSFLLDDVSSKMGKMRENFGGLHFFNPVVAMKLVEVIRAPETSELAYDGLSRFCRRIGKTPVKCKDSAGFIVNRLLFPYLADAMRLAEGGDAEMRDIDTAMRLGTGYPMGPFEVMDYIGLDTVKFILDGWHQRCPEDQRFTPCPSLEKLVTAGKLGRKNGEGFYRYSK